MFKKEKNGKNTIKVQTRKKARKMLFLFNTLLIISIIILLIITIKIQIKIENLQYHSEKQLQKNTLGKNEKTHLNQNYKAQISIYTLGKIPILKIKITKSKIDKLKHKTHIEQKIQEKIKQQDFTQLREKYNLKIDIKQIAKSLLLSIDKLNLKIELGTENAVLTSFLIPTISTILSLLIAKNQEEKHEKIIKQQFQIIPIYQNKNLINFSLEGIFELKMIHIITTICILKKKRRVDKHERTSNRRSYDYSYE